MFQSYEKNGNVLKILKSNRFKKINIFFKKYRSFKMSDKELTENIIIFYSLSTFIGYPVVKVKNNPMRCNRRFFTRRKPCDTVILHT